MGAKICMNTFCGATASTTWKRGWELRSGQIADLCLNCGSAYEKLAYCDTFHSEETGWRECSLCNKRLHCGCSASLPFIEIQDFGGVWCINCARTAGCHKNLRDALPSEAPKQGSYASCELQDSRSNDKVDVDSHNDGRLLKLGILSNSMCFGRQMDTKSPIEFSYKGFENVSQPLMEPPKLAKPSDDLPNIGVRDVQEPKVLPSLNINLGVSDSKSFSLALPGGTEERENNRPSVSQSMQKACHILPKPSKNNLPKSSDANKRSASQKRLARPPAEARLRNQLLPRYWPRITDQELQKLSGDLNSTIVPLFEKVLSVSDASRIGRLVLPKACAEAYFPQINQSEGLPLRVQDVKGNEWTFQFRFWPNNNSRMYVLEGVTPCMQTMQLEAGDTVTFSRIDPGGKLIIGSRKTSNSLETQDQQIPASHNGMVSEDNPYSDVSDSPATVNGYTGLIQSFKRGKENSLNVSSEHSNTLNGDVGWSKNENFKGKVVKDLLRQPKFSSEAKALTVGPKSKKILMHSEDAMELRMSWGETHDLLRPPPNIQPHIVVVEEFEFEEYDEPPVFGKRTLFTTGLLGVQNQWARCDKCEKWRKLPLDVLLPPKWSCLDNVWDLSRSSCSAPEEISSEELDQFLRVGKDSKKRKVSERSDAVQGCKASGLDALANAAVLGDPAASRESVEPSSGATTRHPRHRPGCTCIVCIQPPSGKGKHEADCSCNVCLTVKRRFKTLMMRKKQKRQCEREAEKAEHKRSQNDYPTTEPSSLPVPPIDTLQIDVVKQSLLEENEGGCKEIIDLNCHPAREDDMQTEAPSMLNDHISQNETASLLFDNGIKEGENNHDLPEPKNMAEPSDEPENVVSVTVDEVIDRESISIVNLIESSRTYKLTSFGD